MQAAIELLEVNDVITKFDNDAIIAIPLAVANKEINLQDLYQIISNYI